MKIRTALEVFKIRKYNIQEAIPLLSNLIVFLALAFSPIFGSVLIDILDLPTLLSLVLLFTVLSIISGRLWYKTSFFISLSTIINFVLLTVSLIVLPFLRISLKLASLILLWTVVVSSVASITSLIIINFRFKTISYLMIILLAVIAIIGILFILQVSRILGYMQNFLVILIILEILIVSLIEKYPTYFFNLFRIISFFSVLAILTALYFNLPLVIISIATLYAFSELLISYASFERNIGDYIVSSIKAKLDYSSRPSGNVKIPLYEIFDKQFEYELYLFGDKLINALFRKIDARVKWVYNENGYMERGDLEISIGKWIDAIERLLHNKKSFSMNLHDFLSKTNLNRYKLMLVLDYFDNYLIYVPHKNKIYYLDEDYRRVFVDAAPLKGKIFDLLTFCPEIKVIKAVLRNGGFIAEEGLLWLYNAYKNGNIAKREIVEILSDESLPFWPKDLVNKIQKNGIIGFEEWLREHNII